MPLMFESYLLDIQHENDLFTGTQPKRMFKTMVHDGKWDVRRVNAFETIYSVDSSFLKIIDDHHVSS